MSSAVSAGSPERRAPTSASRALSWDISPQAWIVIAAVAIGALLRFSTLGHQSFWTDEADTVHDISLSFTAMLGAVAHKESTPPLYFIVTWVWTRIFSADEVGLRSFSALAGTATIPVVYLCGRELISRSAGVIAAILTAISPFMIWYSQEARAYELLAFFSALGLLFFARALKSGSQRDLTLWAVISILGLGTHFFAALLVFPEGLWLVYKLRTRAVVVAFGVVVLAQLALSPYLLSDASRNQDDWIAGLPLHYRIQMLPVDFGASQTYKDSGVLRWGLWGAGLLVAVLFVLGCASTPERRRGLALVGGLGAVAIVLPVLGALVGTDFLFSRNLTPAWIPLIVVIGGAVCTERARPLGIALLVAVAALFIWGQARISTDNGLQRPDWRGIAHSLGPATVPRAVLVYDGNLGEGPLSLYLPGTSFSYSGTPNSRPRLALRQIDVIAGISNAVAPKLPAGIHEVSARYVDRYYVFRFALSEPMKLTPAGVAALAGSLVTPTPAAPSVLVQR